MKMKRTLSILLACLLLLTACGDTMPKAPDRDGGSSSSSSRDDDRSEPDKSGESSQPDGGAGSEDNTPGTDEPLPLISFNYAIETVDTPKEYANIVAFSQDGIVVWEYTTQKLDVTELERVAAIGLIDDGYYFVCNGSVICLDARTGQERWKNDDFEGAQIQSVIGDGVIYLCGYYGPDLFAISTDGTTVKKLDSLDSNYYWPCGLELSGDTLTVTMSGGPDGSLDAPYYPIRVNINEWRVELD